MVIVNRKIRIVYKFNPLIAAARGEENSKLQYSSYYEEINKDLFDSGQRFLAQYKVAVDNLLSRQAVIDLIAPVWLGLSSKEPRFVDRFQEKFYATRIGIDMRNGTEWDISYRIDYTDVNRQIYYDKLVRDGRIIVKKMVGSEMVYTSTQEIEEAIVALIDTGYIKEDDLALYAEPMNPEHYIKYTYARCSKQVAKDLADMNKSSNIDFVLIDAVSAERTRKAKFKLEKEATQHYMDFISKPENVDSYVLAYCSDKFGSIGEFLLLNKDDKESLVFEDMKLRPEQFVKNSKSTLNDKRAHITKLLYFGLISKNVDGVYTDGTDTSVVLGNTVDEVLTYLGNPINKPYSSGINAKATTMMAQKRVEFKAPLISGGKQEIVPTIPDAGGDADNKGKK